MKGIDWVALLLLVVGGLNWLLVGAFEFDLVAAIFGEMSAASRIVYVLVGLSAIWVLVKSLSMRRVDRSFRETTTTAR
jgi:uncharacterized protein